MLILKKGFLLYSKNVTVIKVLPIILLIFSCSSRTITTLPGTSTLNILPASEIVVDAFKTHDVVFIGEPHWMKEQVTFVASLIPLLQQKGIHILFSEFARYDDNDKIDSLLQAPAFDEEKARQIAHNGYWYWAYDEYLDLYRTAWRVNKNSSKKERFRIIGMNNIMNYSVIQTADDLKDRSKRLKYFGGTEEEWAKRIFLHAVDSNKKALVYCGAHHAFTYYKQPVVNNGNLVRLIPLGDRVGQQVYLRIKDRAMTFLMHTIMPDRSGYAGLPVNPLNGKIDSIWYANYRKPFGFYTETSPLGRVVDTTSVYSVGYPNFTLMDMTQGYLVITPTCEVHMATLIPDFINSKNLYFTNLQYYSTDFKRFPNADSANKSIENNYKFTEQYFNSYKKANCNTIPSTP